MVPPTIRTDAEATFVAQLELIDRIIASVSRRRALEPDEADDFASYVKVRLIENEYRVIEKFQNRSSIASYLSVVIANLFRDYRTEQWGRWRSSMAAKRLGPMAIQLEILLYRDGYTLGQAAEVLRSNGAVELSDREIAELAAQLPEHVSARVYPEAYAPSPGTVEGGQRADDQLLTLERTREWETACSALERALVQLPPEDQLILRLRFWETFTVAEIARTLRVDQKPLYRRIENALARLRGLLEADGVNGVYVADFLSESLTI